MKIGVSIMANGMRWFGMICLMAAGGLPRGVRGDTVSLSIHATPSGAQIKPLLGINCGPYRNGPANPDLIAQFKDIGVTQVRTHGYGWEGSMAYIYTNSFSDPNVETNFNFSELDLYNRFTQDNGHEVYLRIGDDIYVGGKPPAETNNWALAAAQVIRHYAQGQWQGYEWPLRYVEVWNEPDNRDFWKESQTSFLSFFAQVAIHLKEQFPLLKIGGPGFSPGASITPDGWSTNFLAYCRAHNVPLDFVSWHAYTVDIPFLQEQARHYRYWADYYGYTNAEMHCTEWHTNEGDQRTNALGAACLTALWMTMQDEAVDAAHFFRNQDRSSVQINWYGLFSADGGYKKAAHAFKTWRALAEHKLRAPVGGATTGVAALAGFHPQRPSLAVLLSHHWVTNHADTITDYSLSVTGFPADVASLSVRRYVVSDLYDYDLVETTTLSAPFLLERAFPTNTVELLLFEWNRPSPVSIVDFGWETATQNRPLLTFLSRKMQGQNALFRCQPHESLPTLFLRTAYETNRNDKQYYEWSTDPNGGIWDDDTEAIPVSAIGPTMVQVPGGGQPGGPFYDFWISKYEISNLLFVEFLNDIEAAPGSARAAHTHVATSGAMSEWGDVYMDGAMLADQLLFDRSLSRIEYHPARPLGLRYAVTAIAPSGGGTYDDHPAVGVTWYGALKYCNWLTQYMGYPADWCCYHEGPSPSNWCPSIVTHAQFTNGFDSVERKTWIESNARFGFRLPMAGTAMGTGAYNEFFKAAAWNGTVNTRYGFGRDAATPRDANYFDSLDPFDNDTTPVGYFDGFNPWSGSTPTSPNDNLYGIHDLSGNAAEWSNDPGEPDRETRWIAGGSFVTPVDSLDLSLFSNAPPHAANDYTGFRIVQTVRPAFR